MAVNLIKEKYLIINADDFGLCKETNEAVEQLFDAEKITSCSLLVPCKGFKEALGRKKNNSRINMGLHSVLTSDFRHEKFRSVASSDSVSSLVDEEGCLYPEVNDFYRNARAEEVTLEFEAQLSLLEDQPDHMDNHGGVVYGIMGPSFLKETLMFCAKYQLPFRLPKSKAFLKGLFQGSLPEQIDIAHDKAVSFAQTIGVGLIDTMITNPYPIEGIENYNQLKDFYLAAIRGVGEGITELFLHPSLPNKEYSMKTPQWQKRLWEYQFLMETDLQKIIKEEGITLVSWGNAPF